MIYTVLDCQFKKHWTSSKGREYASYHLTLDDGERAIDIESALPAKAAEPKKGEQIEGDIEPGRFGAELRNAKVRGSESSGKTKEPFRKHPVEVAAVRRSAAQKVAVQHFGVLHQMGRLAGQGATDQWLADKLLGLIDYFEKDVERAELRAQAGRLADAGERAVQSHVGAPQTPPGPDPSEETREEMEERIREEVMHRNQALDAATNRMP